MGEMTTVRTDDLHLIMSVAGAKNWDLEDNPDIAQAWRRLTEAKDGLEPDPVPGDGQFMGHTELTGYVTDITIGGEPGFRVDLPEKLWGGNELAWEEYSAKVLFSRRPVTQESVRAAWDETLRRAEERRRWQEEAARYRQAAIASAPDDEVTCICDDDAEPEPACPEHGHPF